MNKTYNYILISLFTIMVGQVVSAATVTSLYIHPQVNFIEKSGTIDYLVFGLDSVGTIVRELTDSVVWTDSDSLGSINVTGRYTSTPGSDDTVYISADYNGLVDTANSYLSIVSSIKIGNFADSLFPDTALTANNDTTIFVCRAWDDDDTYLGEISVLWSVAGDDSVGFPKFIYGTAAILELTTSGTGNMIATSASGIVDSSGLITVNPSILTSLVISPDTITTTLGVKVLYEAVGKDVDDNITDYGTLTWEVLGGIGTIDSLGEFTSVSLGSGKIIATSSVGGITDTTASHSVVNGDLQTLVVTPSSAVKILGDSIQFTPNGYDQFANPTTVGTITWTVSGGIGTIDSNGLFIATSVGTGRVKAVSSLFSVESETNDIEIGALYVDADHIGSYLVDPLTDRAPLMSIHIENSLPINKYLTGITVRDATKAKGTLVEALSNIDSLYFYVDFNENHKVDGSDSLLGALVYNNSNILLVLDSLELLSGQSKYILVTGKISKFPTDLDSLDLYLYPAIDIQFADGFTASGNDSINSLGFTIVNGMISQQLSLVSIGNASISSTDSIYSVLEIEIPRNGYLEDTLVQFSTVNIGTLPYTDVDSLILYMDSGDDTWTGAADEIYVGKLFYTGSSWIRSGLSVALTDIVNRFYVAVDLVEFPLNNKTLSFGIPLNGIEFSSDNDGPIDFGISPVDTFTVISQEVVQFISHSISPQEIIPGDPLAQIFGMEITNTYFNPVALDSIRLSLIATDPYSVTQAQLDSQIDSVMIFLKTISEVNQVDAADSLLAVGYLSNGSVVLDFGSHSLDGIGGKISLTVVCAMNLQNAKDRNTINFEIADSSDIYFSTPVSLELPLPFKNADAHLINGFPAERILINDGGGNSLYSGQTDQQVLDITLPSNGFFLDFLRKIQVQNIGSIRDKEAILALKLWEDISGDGYTADDTLIGNFTSNLSGWSIDGLFYEINSPGSRVIITADISADNSNAGTFQLEIPEGGLYYWSTMDGPDDSSITNAEPHIILPSNSVTLISIASASKTIYPGSIGNNILSFALYNGYSDLSQTLQSITLTNISLSQAGYQYSLYELGQVSLYLDENGNRIFDDSDALLTAASFADSTLQLSGLNLQLPNEGISHFFVVINSPLDMIDSDSLAISIDNLSDLIFEEDISLNGDLPVTSGGYLIVDGSIRRQYQQKQIPSQSLSQGDSNQLLFAFKPAYNGILADNLNSLTIENVFDANDGDISLLQLWLDRNGDNDFQVGDSLLGTFSYISSKWVISSLNLSVDTSTPLLMVVGDVSPSAISGRRFRGKLPIDGAQFASGNDGPVDAALIASGVFTISSSGLKVNYTPLSETYSISQPISLRFTVTNLTGTLVDSIYGLVSNISNPALVTFDSGFVGPVSLFASESQEFVYYYTADSIGVITWDILGVALSINDSSAIVSTDLVTIQSSPSLVQIDLINSMPTSATFGQTNIFPLTLNIIHPETLSTSADLRLDSLTLKIDNGSDSLILASDVFSRMVLSSGYTNLTIIDVVPSVSSVRFIFSEPLIIGSGEQQSLTLLIDISDSAIASNFRIVLEAPQSINLLDKNQLTTVSLAPTIVFPLVTASCRIDEPSLKMDLYYEPVLASTANLGQIDFKLVQLNLRHPALSGSSQIQLTELSVQFVDSSINPVDPANVFDRVIIKRQQSIIAELTTFSTGTAPLPIPLNAPLTLSPGQSDSITIEVWIKTSSIYQQIGLSIADSTAFVVRDLSSGSLLAVATDTTKLATGSVFPIFSGLAQLKQPAQSVASCLTTDLPASIIGGSDAVDLITIDLDYQYPAEYSSIIVSELLVNVYDSLGSPLNPSLLFDRIGYRIDGGAIIYQSFVELKGGAARFRLSSGIVLNPGDSHTITISADIELDAPYDHFILEIQNSNDIVLIDQTDTTQTQPITIAPGCSATIPYITIASSIFLPAGKPTYVNNSSNIKLAYQSQKDVELIFGNLSYQGSSPEGDILINSLYGVFYQRTLTGRKAVSGNLIFDNISLYIDNQLVATDSLLISDTLSMVIPSGHLLQSGDNLSIELKADMKSNVESGNYYIELLDSTFIDLTDKNLSNQIYLLAGNFNYPFLSTEISVTSQSLENSFSNYPNPFNINEGTIVAFVLEEDADIDIELFTLTGERILKLVESSYRTAGEHNSDKWYGTNSSGLRVISGTYFCQITARYISGKTESFRRKISVIR